MGIMGQTCDRDQTAGRRGCLTIKKILSGHSHISAFFITFLAMTVFCLVHSITPFGDNTFLYDDLRREYIRYYAYFSSVIRGGSSLFYFSGKSLGGSVLGLFMIYVSSPLNLLYALFPVEYYPEVLSFLMVLRLSLLSLTSDVFLKYMGLKKTLPFSVSAGMSLWAFSFLVNPLWVDAAVFFPIFMMAALWLSEKPSSTKRFILFALATAFQLYLNYYLSYMMLAFLAILMIIRTILRRISIRSLLAVFLSGLSGIMIMMPLLLPVLKELLQSEKDLTDTPLLERLFENLSPTEPALVLSKLFSYALDGNQIMFGMPHLFCGTLMIPLFLLFFIKKEIPKSEKIETLILSLIILISFCFPPLDLLWHVGNIPNGFPYRYAFLFTGLMIMSAARAWNAGMPSERELNITFLSAAALNILILIRMLIAPGMSWYSPVKAAAGLMILALEYGLIKARFIFTSPIPSFTCILLFMLCITDLSINQHGILKVSHHPPERASDYRNQYREKKDLIDRIKTRDTGFYRLEDTYSEIYDSLDDSMAFGYRGVSHYSTGDHISVRLFLKALGFNYNRLNYVYTSENTDTCDSVLNIRYLLTPQGICENKNTFPSAVNVSSDISREMITDSPFELQEELVRVYAGYDGKTETGIFIPVDIISDQVSHSEETHAMIRRIRFRTGSDGKLYFYIKKLPDKSQDMNVSLNGKHISDYANLSALKILDLGSHDKNEECLLELTLRGSSDTSDFGTPLTVTEDIQALEKLSHFSQKRALTVEELSPTRFLIKNASKGNIFICIPYEEGFRAHNIETGEEYRADLAFGALTRIDATENGDVILSYHVPGMKTGFIMSITGILLILAFSLLNWKRTHDQNLHSSSGTY